MFEFQRQHPVATISRAFSLIKGNFVTIIVFLVVGARSESFPFLWWIGGGFVFLLILGVANWWRFQFRIEDGELHIRSGIFVRKNLYLSKDRIQVIDITAGIIQRLFGLVRVDIQTAGSTSREAAIEATTIETAREINRLLRGNGSEQIEGESAESEAEVNDVNKEFKLPPKELLIAASTSGSFGIALSILATVFSQIEPLISESELFEYLFERLPAQTDAIFFITVIVIFVVFAWLLSFFSTLFSYGNFTLSVKNDELVITRGVFEKKRVTVPYNRIQAIHVTEGMIRQPLGYASVHLESAGYGDETGTGSIVLYPLIKKSEILSFLNSVVPSCRNQMPGEKLPVRSLRRYILRSTFLITAVIAPLYFWLELNNWIWLIPALAMLWGWLKFKDTAIGWRRDAYIIRSRQLSKTTAFVNRNRVQDISLSQSPFQKFRKLCTLTVHVASGDRGKTFSVRDLELETGKKLLKLIKIEKGPGELPEPFESSTRKTELPGWNQAAN